MFGVQIQLIKSELTGRIMLIKDCRLFVLSDKKGEELQLLPLLF